MLTLTLVLATLTPAEDVVDAEAGGDAGNLISEATPLPGAGVYKGTLISTDDKDWFVLPLPEASSNGDTHVCARATVVGSGKSDLILTSDIGAPELRNVADSDGAPITLAARLGTDVYNGLEPFALIDMPTEYTFTMEAYNLSQLGGMDAGTGKDAGNSMDAATPFSGACISGIVRNVNDLDVYVFEAAEGDLMFLSLEFIGTKPLDVKLVSPSGNIVKYLDGPDAMTLDVTENGTWYLVASPPMDTTMTMSMENPLLDGMAYILGLEVDGKPTRPPCRPHCLT